MKHLRPTSPKRLVAETAHHKPNVILCYTHGGPCAMTLFVFAHFITVTAQYRLANRSRNVCIKCCSTGNFTLCPERLCMRGFALNLLHIRVFSNHFTWKGKFTSCTATNKDRVNDVLDHTSPNPYFKTYFKSFIDKNYLQFLDSALRNTLL